MKVRNLLISLYLLASAAPFAEAGNPLAIGVEWGGNAMFYQCLERNFLDDDSGYRLDTSEKGFFYHANGSFRGYVGYYPGEKVRIDLGTGFIGIADSRREIPLTLRFNYLAAGRYSDGIAAYMDGGAGFRTLSKGVSGLLCTAGVGYRRHLFNGAGLSFLMNLRLATDRPGIISPDGSGFVPEGDIRRNEARYLSAGITLSLDF